MSSTGSMTGLGAPRTDNVTNEQLFKEKATQNWLQRLSGLHYEDVLALESNAPSQPCRIPLYESESGDEYQINLGLPTSLPQVFCVHLPDPYMEVPAISHFQLQGRTAIASSTEQEQNPTAIPLFVFHLGSLDVSTASRYPDYILTKDHVTERTDYDVVVQIDNEDMPLWVVAARRQLKMRAEDTSHINPIPPLPIFKGLMDDLEESYDVACILDSIHKLGAREPDCNFERACELVRKTRANINPLAFWSQRTTWKPAFKKFIFLPALFRG